MHIQLSKKDLCIIVFPLFQYQGHLPRESLAEVQRVFCAGKDTPMYCKTLFIRKGLYFRVNSREHRDAKIKSLPIICNVRIIEEDMTSRKNEVS